MVAGPAAASSTPTAPRAARWTIAAWIALALAPALVFAATWFALATSTRTTLLAHVLYWLMPVTLVLAGIAFVRAWRSTPTPLSHSLTRHAPGLAAAALATAAVFATVPASMRWQFDETTLLGTSRCMHYERIAMMATQCVPAPSEPLVIDWSLDKRPPLFAFLVSVAHDLTGYRVANAFAGNALALLALLALVAARARAALGVTAALAAPPLLLCVPLLTGCATSAGFDLLATLLLAVVVTAAIDFANERTAARANWLLASSLLFAQARYESIFVLPVLALLVGFVVRRWPRDGFGRALQALAPALMTPVLLLLVHARDPNFYPEANGQSLVSLAHFAAHAPAFVVEWLRPGADSPFPGALGIASLVAFAWWGFRHRRAAATWIVAAPVAAVTAIALAWFYGDPHEGSAARLFLPASVLGALGPLLLLRLIPNAWLARALLVAATIWATVRVHAVAAETTLPRSRHNVALDAVDLAIANVHPDPHRTLLVSTIAQYLIVRGQAAMTPQAWGQRAREIPAGAEVIVLETPLDAASALQGGDPRDVLRGARATQLGSVDGDMHVAVWRLER
jgi:hypothetical protein